MSIAVNRLTEERKNWRKDHPAGFYARPIKNDDNSTDIMKWEVGIPGKDGHQLIINTFRLMLVTLVLQVPTGKEASIK